MGLSKGAFTFSRFLVVDPPSTNAAGIDEQLKKNAFINLPDIYAEKSAGWSVLDNPLEDDICAAGITFGDYLAFCIRIDRRQVSPALVRIKTMEAEKKFLNEKGLKKLPKALRLEIRDGMRERLMRQAQPVPAFFDLCWDPRKKTIWFGSVTDKVIEEFENLFKESFGARLACYRPAVHFGEVLPVSGGQAQPANENYSIKNETIADDVALHREFLTWLWFKAEERGGSVAIPGGQEIEIALGKRFVLTSGDGEYAETVVCQGRHSDHKEARVGLRKGKMIREARLQIAHDSLVWEFTLKADRLQFQSVQLPAMSEDEEELPQGRLLDRIYMIEQLTDYVDNLYRLFFQVRNSPAWVSEELPRLERVLVGTS